MGIRPAFLLLVCLLAPAITLASGPGKPAPDDKVTLTVTARVKASANWSGKSDKHTPRNEERDEFESLLSETVVYRIVETIPVNRGGGWRLEKLSHRNRQSIAGGGTRVIEGDDGVRNTAEWSYTIPGECPGESRSRILKLGAARATVDVSRFFLCKVRARGAEKHAARWNPGAAAPTYETTPIDIDSTWALGAGKQVFDAFRKKHGTADGNTFTVEASAMPIRGGSVQYTGNGSYFLETTDPAGRKLAGAVSANVTIYIGEPPPPQKPVVVLRPPGDYSEWLPRDGNQTSVTCAWKGERATRVRFTLFEVSNEPGTCTNSPPVGSNPKAERDPDLAIVAKGDFRIEKVDERTWTATGEAGSFGAAAAAKDVAHELGHACGLKHHGDAVADLSVLGAYEKDASGNIVLRDDEKGRKVHVYDAKGQEIGTRLLTVQDWRRAAPARHAGPASGDVNCIMNYDSVFSWSIEGEGGIIHLANKPLVTPGNAFCTSPNGTGYNAGRNRPFSLFGDARPERSNCLSRIRIKDWD